MIEYNFLHPAGCASLWLPRSGNINIGAQKIIFGYAEQLMINYLKKIKLSDFTRDKFIILMTVATAAINWYLWHYLKISIDPSNAFATLHFTASFGVDLIGSAADIYDIYYEALLFLALNLIFARLAYNHDIFSSYILISLAPVLNLLMLFNGYMIISANG